MNLIEARKSGKMYKRPCFNHWCSEKGVFTFTTVDLDADDYILKPDEKKKVKVYRPILLEDKSGDMLIYTMAFTWTTSKRNSDSRIVGWEEKEIEVSE
jgi:hypothetical protein